ncbi:hypothetical protein [Massilia sp. NP310]|uniref:hypothetical protein n=1 Tax=Massilia sp. NP310 TaxID=2861282 RepID=UPI001C631880|nr:hypothetical protein [Massilia sp. NP310]QYG03892.1 hypothetical protein KY496_11180 [Massilia sp. NP310]
MKAWLMALAFSRRAQPVTATFDKNGPLVVPAGVSSVSISGYGARGTDGFSGTVRRYRRTQVIHRYVDYVYRRTDTDLGYGFGSMPGSYCEPETIFSPGNSVQECMIYSDASYTENKPPTTGTSATGLGKTFPGSYGDTAPAKTSLPSVPVTGGASYNIVVPAGGLVTVTYYL